MKRFFFNCLIFLIAQPVFAQGVTIGSNQPADPAAILDLQSNSRGFLISRLTTIQRNAILNPPAGLQIYNVDSDCLEMFFATGGWKPVQCGCSAFPNAQFLLPPAYENLPATFQAPAPNMTYSWVFQGGSPATASSQTTQVTWTTAGKYGVTLTATDSASCSSTYTDSVVVSACQPYTITLSNCGNTGYLGPSQSQCDNTYGAGVVTVTGGIQYWTVPITGTYRIEAAGAAGGSNSCNTNIQPGKGALMIGEFSLTAGTQLKIMVGQRGNNYSGNCGGGAGGGGGGTFVATNTNVAMIVAAGGNGANWDSWNTNGPDGRNTASGTGGGTAGRGGGGGGFTGNGTSASSYPGGSSFTNGGAGGNYTGSSYGASGGFGGGGAANHEGGGGGGYQGGSVVPSNTYNTSYPSYGAGSYNSGANQNNQTGINTGHGYVVITRICQ